MTITPGVYVNAASSTIATTALTTNSSSATLHAGDGAKFPATGPYLVSFGDSGPLHSGTGAVAPFEVALVTSRSTDTLQGLVRGMLGTTPSAWATGTSVALVTLDGMGDLWGIGAALANIATLLAGTTAPTASNTAQALATSGTIATAGLAISRITEAGDVTAVVLQAGTVDGQQVIVENHAAHSATFDVAGTSHVADGASDAIAGLTAAHYVWSATASLWYRCV